MRNRDFNSFYPCKKKVPETSIVPLIISILIGIFIPIFFSSIITYIGLYASFSVALLFPTVIFSIIVVRILRGNIIQAYIVGVISTAAQDIIYAMIFTVPILILLGIWTEIDLIAVILLCSFSGLLGVFFATLLRKVVINNTTLKFPESIAISSILTTAFHEGGNNKSFFGTSLIWLIFGIISAGIFTFLMKVLGLFNSAFIFVKNFLVDGKETYISGGFSYSPALVGIGWIIGPWITFLMFLGSLVSWIIITPMLGLLAGFPIPYDSSQYLEAQVLGSGNIENGMKIWGIFNIWENSTIFIAIGVLIVALLYILFRSRFNPYKALINSINSFKKCKPVDRCDEDIHHGVVWILIAISFVILSFTILLITGSYEYSLLTLFLVIIFGLILTALTGFLTGIVGSSNTPILAIIIVMIPLSSFILFGLNVDGLAAIGMMIIATIIITCITTVSSSLFQNMATAKIIGAKPLYIQIGTIIGIVLGIVPSALIIYILHKAYALGSTNLPVPQAFFISAIIRQTLGGGINLSFIFIGIFIGLVLCVLDYYFKNLIVFAFAIGMYLPFTITTTLFIGGLIRYLTNKILLKNKEEQYRITSDWELSIKQKNLNFIEKSNQKCLLFSSGLIAGEALVGIVLVFLIYIGFT